MTPAPKAQKSPACLLVVEDEILIRMLLADELRAEGFSVIEAATANEALSYFQAGFTWIWSFRTSRCPGV